VGGDPPDKDVYTVRARTELRNVRAFLLEALEHPSLPGMGPGRGDGNRANFVLNDFSVGLHTLGLSPDATNGENSEVTKLEFSSATSSFSQNNWSVEGAIDASAKTGWAIGPKFDSSHSATFILKRPIDLKSDKELRFTLVQSFGNARTIGCFRISALTGDPTAESVDGQLLELAAKPSTEWSAVERAKLLDYRTKQDAETLKLAADIGKLERKVGDLAPDTTLVMVELAQPRETRLFERGDYKSPGDLVTADTPAVLHAMPAGPANRLTLANWLVAPENPLVARVTVNRWWAEIFGQGIVATVEDFGLRGEPPTHPELLDWLAVDFVENGWSIKQLLKTIVMSATYQQSSIITPQSLAVDDQNRWLARGPRLRMDAEMIRDNALAIGGLLDVTPFGPAIYPYQPDGIWTKVGGQNYEYKVSAGSQQYRRGIYVVLKRGAPYPSFINFDANARLACTVKRSRTNTPLQALTLLNDPVYVEAARALAERVLIEKSSSSRAAQIDYAFELCVARKPTRQEREILEQLYDQQLAVASTKAGRDKDGTPVEEAWFSLATTLLNLHETITKD
jgi:hypothetical protein